MKLEKVYRDLILLSLNYLCCHANEFASNLYLPKFLHQTNVNADLNAGEAIVTNTVETDKTADMAHSSQQNIKYAE